MNVFFISSPRGIPGHLNYYVAIVDAIKMLGHVNISGFPEKIQNQTFFPDLDSFYNPTISNIKKASLCIFETSTASIGVGHLLSLALQMDKPIIALYLKNNPPSFLEKVNNDKVQVLNYTLENIVSVLEEAIEYSDNQQDSRFNLMLPSSINTFLDEVAKQESTSKAAIIRKLIIEFKNKKELD